MEERARKETIKGVKTKRKILQAALKRFSLYGYKATTVRDIASSVGLKQSALYNHFKNKEAILKALIEDLVSSAFVDIINDEDFSSKKGKAFLMGIATRFKLLAFDAKHELLLRFLLQEMYRNDTLRDFYNEELYAKNVKKLSGVLFSMMQEEVIRSGDPLLLSHEFFAPLFFYQNQVVLLKIDGKSTSSLISAFDKHVDFFWESVKYGKQETLF